MEAASTWIKRGGVVAVGVGYLYLLLLFLSFGLFVASGSAVRAVAVALLFAAGVALPVLLAWKVPRIRNALGELWGTA
jgi:hypothetical protein